MKRLLLISLIMLMNISVFAQKDPVVTIHGDLSSYKYAYIIPTSGVTSGSSFIYKGNGYGSTNTANPSEIISGYLMKLGFTILPSISPELAEQTMIVSYGYTGTRLFLLFSYASGIIIQMHNAQTNELLASFETEGCGDDKAGNISQAIYDALELFYYSLDPKFIAEVGESISKKRVPIYFENKTPQHIHTITLRLTYYLNDEKIHEQISTLKISIYQGDKIWKYIKRDKSVRSKQYTVKLDILDFN